MNVIMWLKYIIQIKLANEIYTWFDNIQLTDYYKI